MDELKFYPYPNNIQRRLDTLRQKNAKITEKYLLDQKRMYFSFVSLSFFPSFSTENVKYLFF